MKYESKDIKQRAIDRKFELVNLWIDCDVPAQFWLQQPMEIPDATETELRALKIHWFKMCHPRLYMLCWAVFTCMCAAAVGFSFLLASNIVFICAVLGYLAVVIGHLSLHSDMMETVKWYEDKKLFDEY